MPGFLSTSPGPQFSGVGVYFHRSGELTRRIDELSAHTDRQHLNVIL